MNAAPADDVAGTESDDSSLARLPRRRRERAERDRVGQPPPRGRGDVEPRREAGVRVHALEAEAHRERAVEELLPLVVLQARLGRAAERDARVVAVGVASLADEAALIVSSAAYVSLSGIGAETSIEVWLPAPSPPGLRSIRSFFSGPLPSAGRPRRRPSPYALPGDVLEPEVAVVQPRPADARASRSSCCCRSPRRSSARSSRACRRCRATPRGVLVGREEPARVEAVVVAGEDHARPCSRTGSRSDGKPCVPHVAVLVADAERVERALVDCRVVGKPGLGGRAVVVDEQDVGQRRRVEARGARPARAARGRWRCSSARPCPRTSPAPHAAAAPTCTLKRRACRSAPTASEPVLGVMSKFDRRARRLRPPRPSTSRRRRSRRWP